MDEDLTTDPKGKTIMAVRSAPTRIGQPYVAPLKTTADILAILRDAFARVIQDPELREDSRKLKMPVEHVPAEECLKVIQYVLNQPDDTVKEIKKYIGF